MGSKSDAKQVTRVPTLKLYLLVPQKILPNLGWRRISGLHFSSVFCLKAD